MRERDRRTGDLSDLPAPVARAKRGDAMRGILAELRERLGKWQAEREELRAVMAKTNDPSARDSPTTKGKRRKGRAG
jgi:hypothetical protein